MFGKHFKEGGSENLESKDNVESKLEKSKPKALEKFGEKFQDFKDYWTEKMKSRSSAKETSEDDKMSNEKKTVNQILAMSKDVKEAKKVEGKEGTESKTEKDKPNDVKKPDDWKDKCTERIKQLFPHRKKSETGSNDDGDNKVPERDLPKDMSDTAKQKALEQEKAKKEFEKTEQTQADEKKSKENKLTPQEEFNAWLKADAAHWQQRTYDDIEM